MAGILGSLNPGQGQGQSKSSYASKIWSYLQPVPPQKVSTVIDCGVVKGTLEYCARSGKYVNCFRGIPYAAPPVGALRWRPPQRARPWEGVRVCDKNGPEALQLGADFDAFFETVVRKHGFSSLKMAAMLHGVKVVKPLNEFMSPSGEDCLYINVKIPEGYIGERRKQRLPVMVYFHGGDHQDGAGANRPYYRPHSLASEGEVVLVTFNYRLGLFGNFTHPELSEEDKRAGGAGVCGNYSFLDQIAALQWVQRNISAFGGDPNMVTICGSSAGGESVLYMMVSPMAHGLFHRCIVQSPGNTVNSLLHLRDPIACFDASEERGETFATKIVGSGPGQVMLLRDIPAATLQAHYFKAAKTVPVPEQLFFPVIDGVVLPCTPMDAFERGLQAKVPLIVGYNADEGSLCFPVTKRRTKIRDELYPSPVRPVAAKVYTRKVSERLLELYDQSGTWGEEGETDSHADCQFLGDHVFGQKVYWLAKHHHATGQHVFCYLFQAAPTSVTQTVGAFHGAEIPYIFGAKPWFGPGCSDDEQLSKAMVEYWSAFVRTGDPNRTHFSLPEWPVFDLEQRRRLVLDHGGPEVQAVDRHEHFELMHQHHSTLLEAARSLSWQTQDGGLAESISWTAKHMQSTTDTTTVTAPSSLETVSIVDVHVESFL
ncbi:unnamed protein product [Chrysoparadoxa australica]